jgi:hypothetical protein
MKVNFKCFETITRIAINRYIYRGETHHDPLGEGAGVFQVSLLLAPLPSTFFLLHMLHNLITHSTSHFHPHKPTRTTISLKHFHSRRRNGTSLEAHGRLIIYYLSLSLFFFLLLIVTPCKEFLFSVLSSTFSLLSIVSL